MSSIFQVRLYFKSSIPKDNVVKINDHLSIGVEIINISPNPAWIAGVLDGSETGQRFPHYKPQIKGPANDMNVKEWTDFTSPLRMKDFRILNPGEGFDPTGESFLPLIAFQDFVPLTAGQYSFMIFFSTESKKDEEWLGSLPDTMQIDLLSKVREVPHCTTQSNVLTIEAR